jgi:Zn-finger nucleic acid-binding protein
MAAARSAAAKFDSSSRMSKQGQFYRPCLECGQLMQRKNYDEKSGVLIDLCAAHGVWFDNDELASILRWVRQGRSRLAKEHADELRKERQRRARKTTVPWTYPPKGEPTIDSETWTLLEFLLEVGIFIFRLLR